ncbi:hypothetical protein D3C87_1604670 [compost metagenome]
MGRAIIEQSLRPFNLRNVASLDQPIEQSIGKGAPADFLFTACHIRQDEKPSRQNGPCRTVEILRLIGRKAQIPERHLVIAHKLFCLGRDQPSRIEIFGIARRAVGLRKAMHQPGLATSPTRIMRITLMGFTA